jgi:2,3-bisphosphoglycerate-independent phosphoglycerate mutase
MADRSQPALGGSTPLQAARLENMDRLAALGSCGHMYTLAPGLCPTSDMAHWHLLGYGGHDFPGRAGIEAVGAGIELDDGDVIVRVDLAATMEDGGVRFVQASPAYLPEGQAAAVYETLAGYEPSNFGVKLHHLGGPFMLLVLSGGASAGVTDTDPVFYRIPVRPVSALQGAGADSRRTVMELERFVAWSASVLESHPVNLERAEEGMTQANYVLLKWASRPPRVPSFGHAWGFDAAACVSGAFDRGLASVLGMEVIDRPGGAQSDRRNRDPFEDFANGLEGAFFALDSGHDFVFVNTRAADDASRTGRPRQKVQALQELDRALGLAVESLTADPDILTVFTAGHATPCGGSDEAVHSGESVPVVMLGRNVRVDPVESFDELSCSAGALGQIRGADVMPLILNFTDRAKLGNSRLSPENLPYRPAGGV